MIDLIEIEIRCGIIPKYNILLIPNKNICYIGPNYQKTFMEVLKHGNLSINLDSINYAK